MLLSERLNLIKPSPTLEVTKKANQLKQQGKKIISLSVGEPDFDTPDNIKLKAIEAIQNGYTKYTNVDGIIELKKAIQHKFARENNLSYNLDEIIVGVGAKQIIYNLFMASLNEGDEVIVPAPYWVSYPDIVLVSSGTPIFINTNIESNFKLTPKALADNISPKTKWLILCSPSNPTGSTYSREELLSLAEVLRVNKHVYIMSDNIYEHIIFNDFKFHTLAEVAPDLKDRIFIVNGVSKAYSMTGWRIGYGAGPKNLIVGINNLQSQSTSNACSISQYAALEALTGPQDYIQPNALVFQQKRDLVLRLLSECKDLDFSVPEGAFYLFVSCKKLLGKKTIQGIIIKDDNDFATYLLEDAEVAVVPGVAFGAPGHFRLSFATSVENLTKACTQIINSCNKLI
jgi:aspartate aminotransferase